MTTRTNDGEEVHNYETDPTDDDTDDDGLLDGEEIHTYLTDPKKADHDGDGRNDGDEVNAVGGPATDPEIPTATTMGSTTASRSTTALDPNDKISKPQFSNIDDLVISEIMALGQALGDPARDAAVASEGGNFPDWLEIWNPTNEAVDLAGWTLSDDAAVPAKWAFPAQTLAPNDFLIVFASGENRAIAGGELHTNFQLQGSGEFLGLYFNGALVHAYDPFPEQFGGVSFGIHGDTPPLPSGYFQEPTPGGANTTPAVAGFVADTRFSSDRGFYFAPFDLEITSETAGATIRYTLDGSPPSETNGSTYAGPIPIATTSTVRAMAYKAGFEPTNIDTQTYIFPADVLLQSGAGLPPHLNWGQGGNPDWAMDPAVVNSANPAIQCRAGDLQAIPTISLVMDWEDMFGGTRGIYPPASGVPGDGVDRACSVEMIEPDGSGAFQIDAAVRIVGGTSPDRTLGGEWKSNKLSMRLKFTSEFGPTKLRHAVFQHSIHGEGATDRFDTLILDARLNNTWHYGGGSDPTGKRGTAQYLRDQATADLQRELGGKLRRTIQHMFVYINGVFWGMHTVHERPDEHFAEEYLGGDETDYDVMKHRTSTVVNGPSNANYLALHAAADQNLADDASYLAMWDRLDVRISSTI
ncbi:MAG: FN3 associated domain-containing protein [Verrucomicrobiales bacterium]